MGSGTPPRLTLLILIQSDWFFNEVDQKAFPAKFAYLRVIAVLLSEIEVNWNSESIGNLLEDHRNLFAVLTDGHGVRRFGKGGGCLNHSDDAFLM